MTTATSNSPTKVSIELLRDKRVYAPGEIVSGKLLWVDKPERDKIRLYLGWYGASEVSTDIYCHAYSDIKSSEARGEAPFEFTLPAGPLTYRGKLFAVHWELQATVIGRALGAELIAAPAVRIELELACQVIDARNGAAFDR